MSEYLTEEEKVEAIKEWWKDNGKSVIAGIILGLGGLFGWQGWREYTENRALEASQLYAELQQQVAVGALDMAREATAGLREDYAGTPYPALASLMLARLDTEQNELDAAAEALSWVMDNASSVELQELARIRLARVRLAQEQPEEALALVSVELPAGYGALVDEIKGDAYRAQGELEQAREAYDRAILLASGAPDYLRMKRDALGPAAEAESDTETPSNS